MTADYQDELRERVARALGLAMGSGGYLDAADAAIAAVRAHDLAHAQEVAGQLRSGAAFLKDAMPTVAIQLGEAANTIASLSARLAEVERERNEHRKALAPLDAVVHALGIEDTEDDPAEAVRALAAEVAKAKMLAFQWMRQHDALLGFCQSAPDILGRLLDADPRPPSPKPADLPEAIVRNAELSAEVEQMRAALDDIAKGMIPKLPASLEPAEFRGAMWTWSQERAREGLAALPKRGEE